MISFDTSALLSYYQAKAGLTGAGASGSSTPTATGKPKAVVPTAPWLAAKTPPTSDLVRQALSGHKFVDEAANTSSLKGASPDYAKLFATYQALNTMSALVTQAGAKGETAGQIDGLQKALTRGLGEVGAYVQGLSLDQLRLSTGSVMTSDKASVGVPKATYTYQTSTLR